MSRKGENIYLRKDGRWEGRYIRGRKADGKCRYGYVYAGTYREVRKKLAVRRSEAALLAERQPEAEIVCNGESTAVCIEKTMTFHADEPAAVSANEPADECACEMKPDCVKESSSDGYLFEMAITEWLSHVRCQVKDSTFAKYRMIADVYLVPLLGAQNWETITQNIIESFCRRLLLTGGRREQGLAPKTVADIMSVIRSIFRYTSAHGHRTPCDLSSISIKRESKEMRILSRREQNTLCRHLCAEMSGRNLGILICLFTGLRIGEICALKWEDISLDEQTIYVHRTLQRIRTGRSKGRKTEILISSPKSCCSIRRIPIPGELAGLLAACRQGRSGYVLSGREGVSLEPRTMQRHFQKILREAHLEPVSFHALRHTFATRCVEMNFDVKSLSEILGHANVNITMNRYVHPSMELKRENMQRLSELFAVS